MVRYLAFVAAVLAVNCASGATIVVGTHELLPNTPGQTIPISVSGGDSIQGLDLMVGIGEVKTAASPAPYNGPTITGIDVITGTIFASNNTGQGGNFFSGQYAYGGTTTSSGTVSADGLIGTITVDTTGWNSGSGPWALTLYGTTYDPPEIPYQTDLPPLSSVAITNGWITLQEEVPEPASMFMMAAMMAGGVPAMLVYRRRRRGATPATVS